MDEVLCGNVDADVEPSDNEVDKEVESFDVFDVGSDVEDDVAAEEDADVCTDGE